ncbi:uncharacterized protein LOC118191608 [Stegodyphus dumicola]|uniref:uncharacterized protein LOC118191608 n=1 Tax=Stegodyphus dumicola TaxID=202533 RepID=UPI0015AA8367|nr:uncharacterized protein LOC118191608 [Stegodyphus dumicola]
MKQRCRALRRRLRSATNEIVASNILTAFRQERAAYKKAILEAKINSWRSFCTSNSNPYGILHKLATQKIFQPAQVPVQPTAPHTMDVAASTAKELLNAIFPTDDTQADTSEQRQIREDTSSPCTPNDIQFSAQEIRNIFRNYQRNSFKKTNYNFCPSRIRYKLWCKEDISACIRKSNESLPDLSKRQAILYDSLTREDRIRLGIRFEDFVIYAEYEEEVVTQQFSWYYDYEFTNCYTFNALWGDANEPVKTSVLYNPVTGKSSELIICVNTDVDNYSNLSGSVVGKLQMSIHSNDIVPNPTYDAASLEAGEFYSYGFQKVSTELLKSPYQTKCRSYKEEKERRTGARMSQKVMSYFFQ